MRSMGLRVVLATAIFLMCANVLFAQVSASLSQLDGTITDPTNRVVGKATITLRETETNRSYSTVSNDSGLYVIPNAQPGRYELTVEAAGFAKTVQTGVVLTVGQVATINVTLKIASVGQTVEVTSEALVIEPTKTEISQVVGTEQIQSLPISNRLFTDFALLTPGVATSRTSLGTTITEFEVTQISFGGMRSFSNEITVDGADFVNEITGVQRATPPQDAVQEFRVVNNSFGAEYGRAVGGIVNIVTKSGTNEMHGSIYDYFQNSATNEHSILQKPPLQPAVLPDELRHNQFGATLGGPIRKDKTFFFVNYEGKRRAESPTFAPDSYNNIQQIDIAKAYLGLAPEGCSSLAPNPNITLAQAQECLTPILRTTDNDYAFARLDHQISTNNRLALRYVVEDARDLNELVGLTLDGGGIGSPSGGRNLFVRDQSVVGTLTSLLTPNLVNTALVQYARRHYNFPGVSGQPDLLVNNDLDFGHNFGIYDAVYESRLQGSNSVSWVKGNHLAKFGFDGNYTWGVTNFPGFSPANIRFATRNCLYAFADAVNLWKTGTVGTLPADSNSCPELGTEGVDIIFWGTALPQNNCANLNGGSCGGGFYNGFPPPAATRGGFGSGWPCALVSSAASGCVPNSTYSYSLNHGYWGVFAQDQWRLTPKLTFNYGMRWDYESGLGIQIEPYYHAFQPRIGLAYSPGSKTVIRAGYGLFFDRNNMSFFYIPGNQKTLPGYLCNTNPAGVDKPASLDPACAAALTAAGGNPANAVAIKLPQVRQGAGDGGWQLGAIPASAASVPCGFLGGPSCAGLPGSPTTVAVAALFAYNILTGPPNVVFPYSIFGNPYPSATLTGICNNGVGACGVGAGGIDRHFGKLPYAHQASVQIDRQFGGGFALELGYLFVAAHRLVRGNNINVQCPDGTSKPSNPLGAQGLLNPDGTLSPCTGKPILGPLGLGPIFNPLFNPALPSVFNPTGLEFVGLLGTPPPGFTYAGNPAGLGAGLLDYNNDVANAVYHGLSVTATEKWGQYLNLTANYTYSHTLDNGNFTTFINLPPDQFDYAAERGNSNQDLRHHFVANFTLDAPRNSFLRNFEFSSIITLQSGRPFTLYSGENTLGDQGGGTTDRTAGPPVVPVCPSVQECSTLIGRNTYIGDPLYAWDMRLSRGFHLTEHRRLDLMMDVFNLLDRANVDEVSYVYGPVFCGSPAVIPRHYNDATSRAIENGSVSCASQVAATVGTGSFAFPGGAFLQQGMIPVAIPNTPNPNFGKPRTVLNPRQFQFAAKFSF